jgi:hypothetical protein
VARARAASYCAAFATLVLLSLEYSEQFILVVTNKSPHNVASQMLFCGHLLKINLDSEGQTRLRKHGIAVPVDQLVYPGEFR